MPDDMETRGLHLRRRQWSQLDDIADDLAETFGGAPSRSDAGRTVLPLGIAAWDALESRLGSEVHRMAPQERRALVRQAVLDHLDEDE